jgi:hypothetical protein
MYTQPSPPWPPTIAPWPPKPASVSTLGLRSHAAGGTSSTPPRDNASERVTGIEPALSAWEADVLPLNYTRAAQPL